MSLVDVWWSLVEDVRTSPLTHGAVRAGAVLAIIIAALAVIVLVTFLLRRYFKRNPYIDRTHRIGVYLLTMVGVLVLLLGAALGALLPVIPGILFLFFALLLLRRYYPNRWMDARIRYIRFKLRIKRAIKQRIRRVHLKTHRKSDKNKGLSTKNTSSRK